MEMFDMEDVEFISRRIADILIHMKHLESQKKITNKKIESLKSEIDDLENQVRHHDLSIKMDKNEIITLLNDEDLTVLNGD